MSVEWDSDWFNFKKPAAGGQKLLDEIEEDHKVAMEKKKKDLDKYNKRIRMNFDERNPNDPRKKAEDTEFELPGIFGQVSTIGRGERD